MRNFDPRHCCIFFNTVELDAVLVAVELVLESGVHSAEHVLNMLARLHQAPLPEQVETSLTLTEEPLANTARYDILSAEASNA